MTDVFDMPGAEATFEERGGWVVNRLCSTFNLQPHQAAGIVGNVGYESGGFEKLREIGQPEGRGGYGWGQWTADRRVTFLAYAEAEGLDWRSDEANFGYLVKELSGSYKTTITQVAKTATLQAAVFSVGETYERPGGTTSSFLPGLADRTSWGQRALKGAQGTALPAVAAPVPDTPLQTAVRTLQREINALGPTVAVDGVIGPLTIAAYSRVKNS